MSAKDLTPWWKALKIRPEIQDSSGAIDDVQMSLYQTIHGVGGARPPYADPTYYGEITHPTGQLVDLLAKVAVRLGGGDDFQKAPALWRLDQGMGGGKSHAAIGAYHLAAGPEELQATDVGQDVLTHAQAIIGRALPTDLDKPHVVVLPCDNLTPGAPDRELDGPAVNLWERFLWRLVNQDFALYERYQPFFNDKSKISDSLRSVGRPVLIIIDEILDYVRALSGVAKPELAAQDMSFLRAVLDSINDVPHVAALVVMIASEKDTIDLDDEAKQRRDELHDVLFRNGVTTTVNENSDFAAILRRRIFVQPPPVEVTMATAKAFAPAMNNKAWSKVFTQLSAPWSKDFETSIARTYPFHPQLMQLAENEWANLAGFQKVRSTIRVFAATVYALAQREGSGQWTPLLIGPGDLPLSDATVRESILGSGLITDQKTQANYRSLAQNDVVNLDDDGGAARLLDIAREGSNFASQNPRAAERGATMVFLASIVGTRGQGRRGASESEIKVAASVPDLSFGLADADAVARELQDPDSGMAALEVLPGKGGQPPRLFMSTKQTLNMLVRAARNTITDEERDRAIARIGERLASTGPFKKQVFVDADPAKSPREVLEYAGIDDARATRLVILDPVQFSLRDAAEQATLEAIESAMGLGDSPTAVQWASSAVFAVANAQRRAQARNLATSLLAFERVLDAPEISEDDEVRSQAVSQQTEARKQVELAVRRAFQHLAFLAQPDPSVPRTLRVTTFDDEIQTALDGTTVWKKLVEEEKAFDQGEFTPQALTHVLRPEDYQRPLDEVRDAFWQAPRLPLLFGGEDDLRRAIYEAVVSEGLTVSDGAGDPVMVTGPSEINLSQSGLRLTTTISTAPEPEATAEEDSDLGQGHMGAPAAAIEKSVSFTVMSPSTDPDRAAAIGALLLALYEAVDGQRTSYFQGTVKVVVDAKVVPSLVERAEALGIQVTIQDQ
ncbi:MAG: DUF499 domain-containing protein [Actinomycetota bacterium]